MTTRKLLLLSDGFPPYGSLRAGMFSKYLTEHGWEAHVLTVMTQGIHVKHECYIDGIPPSERICRVTHNDYARKFSPGLISKAVAFFCPEIHRPPGLLEELAHRGATLFSRVPFDCVFATTAFYLPVLRAARDFSLKYWVPWVADLRDIYEQRAPNPSTTMRERLFNWRAILRTRVLLRRASSVTVVSEAHREIIQKHLRSKVEVIFNGYDSAVFKRPTEPIQNKEFCISYTGAMLGQETRNPEVFFKACRRLISQGLVSEHDFKLDFYVYDPQALSRFKDANALSPILRIHATVPFHDVPAILRRSGILLVLTSKKVKGVATTKLFEYMAIGRPVLCVPRDDGTIGDILHATGAGVCLDSEEEVMEFVHRQYTGWRRTRQLPAVGDPEKIAAYSRQAGAAQLAGLLDKACASRGAAPDADLRPFGSTGNVLDKAAAHSE